MGSKWFRRGTLTALASIVDSSQEHFQKHYDVIMSYLKAILVNPVGLNLKTLLDITEAK